MLLGVSEVSVSSCATTVCEPCPGWLSAGAAFPHALWLCHVSPRFGDVRLETPGAALQTKWASPCVH